MVIYKVIKIIPLTTMIKISVIQIVLLFIASIFFIYTVFQFTNVFNYENWSDFIEERSDDLLEESSPYSGKKKLSPKPERDDSWPVEREYASKAG